MHRSRKCTGEPVTSAITGHGARSREAKKRSDSRRRHNWLAVERLEQRLVLTPNLHDPDLAWLADSLSAVTLDAMGHVTPPLQKLYSRSLRGAGDVSDVRLGGAPYSEV